MSDLMQLHMPDLDAHLMKSLNAQTLSTDVSHVVVLRVPMPGNTWTCDDTCALFKANQIATIIKPVLLVLLSVQYCNDKWYSLSSTLA